MGVIKNRRTKSKVNNTMKTQEPITGLPDVTSADNGKILSVVDGSWNKTEVPTELPTVNAYRKGAVLHVDKNGAWVAGDDLSLVASGSTSVPSETSTLISVSIGLSSSTLYRARVRNLGTGGIVEYVFYVQGGTSGNWTIASKLIELGITNITDCTITTNNRPNPGVAINTINVTVTTSATSTLLVEILKYI